MKTRSYLLIGLVLSIAINLTMIGFLAGRASGPGLRPPPPADPSLLVRGLLGDLSESRRSELEAHFREYFGALRPHIDPDGHRLGRGRDQRDLRAALLSDPLDAEALRRAMNGLSGRLCEAQSRTHESFIALMGALTPDERSRLVERLRGGPRFGPGNGQPRRSEPHDPRAHEPWRPHDDPGPPPAPAPRARGT